MTEHSLFSTRDSNLGGGTEGQRDWRENESLILPCVTKKNNLPDFSHGHLPWRGDGVR